MAVARILRSPLMMAAGMGLALAGAQGAAAAPGLRVTAVNCASVLFVGARGTMENGPGSPNWHPSHSDPYGLGGPVNALRTALLTDIAGRRTMQTESVHYDSSNVGTLLTAPVRYFANLQAGVNWTINHLTQWARTCPHQAIVLAGYSQGAMVMHRVMHLLGTKMMSRVTAAVLIADGDQVPGDHVTRYGSASKAAIGAGQYPAFSKISGSSPAKFADAAGSRVLSVCNAGDIVCDTTAGDLNAGGIAVHLFYSWPISGAATKPVRQAALEAFVKTVTWRQIGPTYPPGGQLLGVACPSTAECVAVGSQGLWLTGSGSKWASAQVPLPANANTYPQPVLWRVACPSAAKCVAVGQYIDAAGNGQGLIETWAGGKLRASEAPVPRGLAAPAGDDLYGVSCVSATECVAVGDVWWHGGSLYAPLVLTLSGSSWKPARAPLPANAASPEQSAELRGVACSSLTVCTAVGDYDAISGGQAGMQGFALTRSGGAWTATQTPLPAGPGSPWNPNLYDVGCLSATKCIAVGMHFDQFTQVERALVLTGSGSTWSVANVSIPPATEPGAASVNGITCSSVRCVAVGLSGTNDLVLTATASSWTVTPIPDLGGYLWGVACPSAYSCTAVGFFDDGDGIYSPLLISG